MLTPSWAPIHFLMELSYFSCATHGDLVSGKERTVTLTQFGQRELTPNKYLLYKKVMETFTLQFKITNQTFLLFHTTTIQITGSCPPGWQREMAIQ